MHFCPGGLLEASSMCHLRKPTVAHVPPGWSSDPVSSISSWPSSHRFFFSTLRVPGVLGASLCPLLALLLQFLCVGQTEALTTPTKALCPVPLLQESSNLVSSSYVPCSFSLRICHVLPCIIGCEQGSAHRLLSLRGGFESQSLPFGGGTWVSVPSFSSLKYLYQYWSPHKAVDHLCNDWDVPGPQ